MERRNPDPGSGPIDRRVVGSARTTAEIGVEILRAIPHSAVLITRLLRHPAVPFRIKALAAFAAAYVMSPIDLIPARLPIIGHIDDVILVSIAVDRVLRSVDVHVLEAAWDGTEDGLDLVVSLSAWSADLATSLVPSARLARPPA